MSIARTGRLALVFVSLLPALGRADGTFVWRNEQADIRDPEQKAILLFDDGLEDLVLEVRYEGASEDFGWIVPLPSRPRLRADSPRLFVDLSRATQEPRQPRSERTGRLTAHMGASFIDSVKVIQRANVGIYDAAVLDARGGTALARWLRTNGFRAPPGADSILGDYARRGWVFAVLRITPSLADSASRRALASGTIQPIRFRFRTPQPVYPLRVSALGRARSEVLLYVVARTPLVHRSPDRAVWTEHACGPTPRWIALDPDSAFPGLANGRGFLTKLRAVVSPEQMEDVWFRPYDPVPGLSSTDERQRLEALAHLGWLRDTGGAERLVEFLKDHPGSDKERMAALWALGEIGGNGAIESLVRHAENGPWAFRLEAIESLARLRAREGLPIFVRGLVNPHPDHSNERYHENYVVEACQEHLVRQGDSSCIGSLREGWRGVRGSPRPTRWSEFGKEERVLAALAAAGDATARDTIVQRLVASSAQTAPEALRRSMHDTGSINDFPSGLWPAVQLLHHRAYGGWRELHVWHDLLAPRPEVHDDLLRRASEDPAMTGLGRALLLGSLTKARPSDVATLLAYARRGLGAESLHVTFPVGMKEEATPVRYNVPVWVAAFALGRHRATEALTALWRECPKDDHDLRGELTMALCKADSEVVIPLLEEYVRSDWNARAGAADYAASVIASADGRRTLTRVPFDWDFRMIDVRYRVRTITSQLLDRLGPERQFSLMTDRSLSPWLRLFWIAHVRAYEQRMRAWVPKLRESLDEMARSHSKDEALLRGIEGARKRLEIGDKVYAEHVLPSSVNWK